MREALREGVDTLSSLAVFFVAVLQGGVTRGAVPWFLCRRGGRWWCL